MSQLRFAALVTVVAAAGCYSDAPAQSTLPEPQYVAGPPGGAMDQGNAAPSYSGGYAGGAVATAPGDPGAMAGEAGDDDASELEDPGDQDGSPDPSVGAAPGDVAQLAPGAPGVPGDPTAGVNDAEIDAALDGYGQWVETDDYGQVWRPDATVVGVDFTPYESGGSWAYSDAGWAFACDYPWGWLPFHYGRWAYFDGYWGWVPGYTWGPAWVEWRHGGGVVGWRPLAPHFRDHRRNNHHWSGGTPIRDHRRAVQRDAHWRFSAVRDFNRPHIRSHLYGNPAEGLRMTSTVKAPPLRARATVDSRDLMRNRFAGGARFGRPSPGAVGSPQVRDHRGEPLRAPPPGAIRSPGRPGFGEAPGRTYQPPVRTYPPYQAPVRTYQPPVRTYQPPVRTYQPYQPPVSSQPPVRTYQPPVYHPPAQSPSQPPVRTYQPHPTSPPVRTYQPSPSSPPPRAWSPPSRSSSPPPSHSSPPPPSSSPFSGSHSSGSSHSTGSHSSGSSPSTGSHSSSSSSHSTSSSSSSSSHSSSSGGHRR